MNLVFHISEDGSETNMLTFPQYVQYHHLDLMHSLQKKTLINQQKGKKIKN